MENVSKALLIAAGMFLAILIISLLVVFYNDISAYYSTKHEATMIEQAKQFNSKFENYHRENIRGSDLISLMNRVIDYNASESYFEESSYERIKIKIILGDDNILEQFKLPGDDDTSRNVYLPSTGIITNIGSTGNDWHNDKKLTQITNTSSFAIGIANSKNISMTDTKLQQLASEAQNILVDENDTSQMGIYNRNYRAKILGELLGKDIIKVNPDTGKTKDNDSKEKLEIIKEITSQYYQYMQFKRAYFDCTEVKYDPETNRVIEMNFKLKTKIVNGLETIVMD